MGVCKQTKNGHEKRLHRSLLPRFLPAVTMAICDDASWQQTMRGVNNRDCLIVDASILPIFSRRSLCLLLAVCILMEVLIEKSALVPDVPQGRLGAKPLPQFSWFVTILRPSVRNCLLLSNLRQC